MSHPASRALGSMRRLGAAAQAVVREYPGRLGLGGQGQPPATAEKPGAADTPYRSRLFVNPLESADGNWYKPGEPIPVAEAERQGMLEQGFDLGPAGVTEEVVATREAAGRIKREEREAAKFAIPFADTCPKCRNHPGKRAAMKNHRADCKCVGCQPCSACGGTGRLTEGVAHA